LITRGTHEFFALMLGVQRNIERVLVLAGGSAGPFAV
jgi:hypothetical protein